VSRGTRWLIGAGAGALIVVVVLAFMAGRSSAAGASDVRPEAAAVAVPGSVAEPVTGSVAVAPRVVDQTKDAYAFLGDLVSIEADPARAAARQREVREAWTGARVRWVVLVIDVLCRAPSECWVSVFDRARTGDQPVPGFLPSLRLSEDQHARLLAGCAAHTPCVATIEATAAEVVLRDDVPRRITFDDVQVLEIRGATAGERWYGE
jgi:hypothetical protein